MKGNGAQFYKALRNSNRPPNFNLSNDVVRAFEHIDDHVVEMLTANDVRVLIFATRWEINGAGLLKDDGELLERVFGETFGFKLTQIGKQY